jgi:hypothetical protein
VSEQDAREVQGERTPEEPGSVSGEPRNHEGGTLRPWHSRCRCTPTHFCAACDTDGRLNNLRLGVERLAADTCESVRRLQSQIAALIPTDSTPEGGQSHE